MKIINNVLDSKMIKLLKDQIGEKIITIKYDCHFGDKNVANSAGVELIFGNKELILFSAIKHFDILDGEDYSYLSICDEKQADYKELKNFSKKELISVNQKVTDIQIVTDSYHCTNPDKNIDELYICDYAIIFLLEDCKICFEKFDIWENELEISKTNLIEDIQLFDNLDEFDNPESFATERKRTSRMLKGINV